MTSFFNSPNAKGGGVLMYIKSSLKCKGIDELIYMKAHIESIYVENKNLIKGNINRPPNSNLE